MSAAAIALVVGNSPLAGAYEALTRPLLHWINDGLMALFFLLVGLEIKRETVDGELSRPSQVALPIAAAIGGMAVPAAIYLYFNRGDALALKGWAIPTATDIAFALGVMALLGSRVPLSLKVFLTAIAIADDLGAIVIIAVFYTQDLSGQMLALAGLAIAALIGLNRLGVKSLAAYAAVGLLLWVFVLNSGVHPTLAGVVLAFAIPLGTKGSQADSLLHRMEHALHPWVAFAILPVFAFANAGVPLGGVTLSTLLGPLPLGIFAGLVVGKFVGVWGTSMALVKLGICPLPKAGPLAFMGTALLCGVGFTMSLFIGSLAFGGAAPEYETAVRLGVLAGSMLSGAAGYALLRIGRL